MRKLYSELNKKRKEIAKESPTYIYQKDFLDGTYLIDTPGYYVLKEDIVFHPNPDADYMPNKDKYKTMGFSLGFFAVIAIYADGVYLDLNGHCVSASKEFTLQQRFFSIIELANSPFIPKQGPSDFSDVNTFRSASNVMIRKGYLGRTSHHGIHGNDASNVLLEKLTIHKFENVGIALNGGSNVVAHKLKIKNNKNAPVLATYSAARFSKMFAHKLLNSPLTNLQRHELTQRLNALEAEMNKTFSEIMEKGSTTSKLFANKHGLPDGNVYGFLAKNRGVGVNDFETEGAKISNIFLRKVSIKNLQCRVKEIVALSKLDGTGAQNDVAGAVLQIDEITDSEGKYSGTLLSELQLYLAQLSIELNMPIGKNSITMDVVHWAKNGTNISTLLELGYKYKYNGDAMFHVCKAAFGYRFDAIENLSLEKCKYSKIRNFACLGNDTEKYSKSHDASKREAYTGADTVGLNLSYCSDVNLYKFKGAELFSANGDAIGINSVFNSSNVHLNEVKLRDIKAGTLHKGKWVGENYWEKKSNYTEDLPNGQPQAIGIRYENNSIVELKEVCIHDLKSCKDPVKIMKV